MPELRRIVRLSTFDFRLASAFCFLLSAFYGRPRSPVRLSSFDISDFRFSGFQFSAFLLPLFSQFSLIMKRFLPPGFVVIVAVAAASFGFLIGSASVAHAVTVSQWTFESPNTPADATDSATSPTANADVGSGIASGTHASASSDWTTPVGNGSANSFSATVWGVGDFWQFQLNTVGFIDILVAFDQTSSGTGPRDFKLAYSVNGSTFTDFSSYTVLENVSANGGVWDATTFRAAYRSSFDLSSIASIENAATLFFRLTDTSTTSASGGTVGTGGTNRVDNFTVSGTAVSTSPVVPESGATLVLLGMTLVPLAAAAPRR
jgi:hypothetical protein